MAEKGTSRGKRQSLWSGLKQEIFWGKREGEQEVENDYPDDEEGGSF